MNLHILIFFFIAVVSGQFIDHLLTPDGDCSLNNYYQCHNGRCVPRLSVCDGFDDCLDGSDEELCEEKISPNKCERENKFMCVDQKRCLPHKYVCNGIFDCEDHSDEIGCENKPEMPTNETCNGYKCGSAECISWYWVCDGINDCGDGTDESHEGCFHKRRINAIENGTLRLCPDTESLEVSMFYCKDRTFCILDSEVCDGMTDCRDGSDEADLCNNWKTQCLNANCDESCKPTPLGPRCKCGQATIEVNNTCSNADYCRNIPSPCSQYCSNENRSYRCSCAGGYKKQDNLCFVNNHNPVLYYTTENEIRSLDLITKQNSLLTTARRPRSAVTDGIWLYWIEIAEGNHNVMRTELQRFDKSKEVFLGIGVEQPDELAIDWLGNNIYLTESQHGFIAVCSITGLVCSRIRDKNDIVHPRFVALDPENGFMYWADMIKVPRIQRAKMDGSDVITLTLNRNYPPSGLSLDLPSKKIYWSEYQVGISVMNFDGSGKYELVGQSIYAPLSIAVFENDVYWYDYRTKFVQSISKIEGSDRRKKILSLNSKVSGISVYHPALYRPMSHTCEHNSCTHLCVVTGHSTYSCLCGEDAILDNDKHTCIRHEPEHYLIVIGSSMVSKIYFHALVKPEWENANLDIGLVQALAYNPNQKIVYIFDSFRKVIHKLYVNSLQDGIKGMFIIPDVEEIVDMAYDYYTDNLYYIEVGIAESKLEVYSIKTQKKSILHIFEEKEIPISICVIPEYGMLMVAIYGMKEAIIRVDRFGMDGNDRFNIYQTKYEGFHVNIAYSADEDLVFISDPSHSVIEQLHPEGTGREHFRKVSTSINNLSAVNKMLFWVNKFSSKLYWANVEDHGNTIGSMQLSKYAEHAQLYLISITKPKPKEHPCLKDANCTHLCVQKLESNSSAVGTTFACLCPPGQMLKNNICTKKVSCSIGQLKCYKSNTCYGRDKKCDGVEDCPNGEDEMDCPDNAICTKSQYNCPYSEICIERHQLCDGHSDCKDNSDENDKYCPIRSCHSDEFMCTNGLCIVNTWVCDGEPDCHDGVDERRCVNNTCQADNFRCRDGQCVDIHLRCNGHKDCLDWSDEEGCHLEDDILPEAQRNYCEGREYICASNKSLCLPISARCNGELDCPLGEDEINCNDFACAPGHYRCTHWQQCVLYAKLCDGNEDCDDGSDENKEACFNKKQLITTPIPILPDVTIPCDDGYRCKNNKCINFKNVCNNVHDCRDGSDEGELCSTACASRPCSQICKATPRGPQCFCHHGYMLDNKTNKTCADINECEWDVCSQECTNIIGSYLCSCYKGYALRTDGHSCKSIMGNSSFVYISGNSLNSVRLHEGHNVVVHQDPTIDDMIDLDFDPRLKILYVTTKKELIAINDNNKLIKVYEIGSPSLIASDWLTGNIYIVDSSGNNQIIKVCHLFKNLCADFLEIPPEIRVKAMTIDVINRKLFYCTWHEMWRMGSVRTGSLGRSTTFTTLQDVHNCTGLAFDYHQRMLYIAQYDGKIRKVSYSGRWGEDLVSNDFHSQTPVGLQLFEDHVYYLDANTHRISRCLNFGSKHCEAHIYRVINAKSFIIRNENQDLTDGESQCKCDGCESKQGCNCYRYEMSMNNLCIDVANNKYYEAFIEKEEEHATIAWVITITILLILLCTICFYMYKTNAFRQRSVWMPNTDCCNPRRRIVRTRLENPRNSWQFTEEPPNPTSREDKTAINIENIHTEDRHSGVTNVSFVNWLYSSIRKKKNRKYEPSVSLHLKSSGDTMHEPLAGSSGNFTDVQNGAESVASDTESEIDVKDPCMSWNRPVSSYVY